MFRRLVSSLNGPFVRHKPQMQGFSKLHEWSKWGLCQQSQDEVFRAGRLPLFLSIAVVKRLNSSSVVIFPQVFCPGLLLKCCWEDARHKKLAGCCNGALGWDAFLQEYTSAFPLWKSAGLDAIQVNRPHRCEITPIKCGFDIWWANRIVWAHIDIRASYAESKRL